MTDADMRRLARRDWRMNLPNSEGVSTDEVLTQRLEAVLDRLATLEARVAKLERPQE